MNRHGRRRTGWVVAAAFALAAPMPAQEVRTTTTPAAQTVVAGKPETAPRKLVAGQEVRVEGLVESRNGDTVILREVSGSTVKLNVSAATQLKERKSNIFRGARVYRTSDIVEGLKIEAKGYGGSDGDLVTREIRFRDDDYLVATAIQSRVAPVEGRLAATESRLVSAEHDTQYLGGQVKELSTSAAETRRDVQSVGAKADSAHAAATSAGYAARAANERIGTLDDYDTQEPTVLHFKVGSTVLSAEAMADLDAAAERAKDLKGYIIEVRGFASADGSEDLNRRLSRDRADAVVRYLVEKHEIPVRRILLPFGFGENQPVADNKTKDGRRQNRRVEVRVLVNRGITAPATQISAQSGPASN
jgi:OmpA-OmpF porin, OOP family